ncbi:MAG: hypothetical protein AUH43_21520 [Acidobacteria bacterium 13_1_40CM_65_14]|nr:MAG: hypothetical protein AUH43_21520 [Acidobacteria bacterium 13_1_40CM_65_14]
MHDLLILSRHAADYQRLIDAARLPQLRLIASSDPHVAAADRFEIVLGEPSLVRSALPRLTGMQWVQSTWAGVEPLLDPSLRRDYILTNARGVFGPQMSEYVFGYMIARERLMFEKYAAQQAGRWDPTPPGALRGKQIGLLGVGSIGAALAATAKHFGMRVKGYTRGSEGCADVDAYFHGDDRIAFANDLDYLVSVMPNTAGTRRLVDAVLLAALPPRAVFINPGRGSVVDERALADALQSGRLAGAVLDVFEQEPLPADHVFWRTPNVLITSHTAALSVPEDIAPVFVDNYRRWTAGEPLRYQVDFEAGY